MTPGQYLNKGQYMNNLEKFDIQLHISNNTLTAEQINSKILLRRCITLCGDGFMDFVHRLKIKILKILKN
jgi:hypothetical protein